MVWACEKFKHYVLGKEIQLETDHHKPLVPLLGKIHLDCLPPSMFQVRSSTLSRAPLPTSGDSQTKLIEQFANTVVSTLPASTERLQEYYTAQLTDTNCVQLVDFCRNGWPKHKHQVHENVRPYWPVQGELSLQGDLLLRGRRIVVPKSLQKETLQKIHSGHQGITKCSL